MKQQSYAKGPYRLLFLIIFLIRPFRQDKALNKGSLGFLSLAGLVMLLMNMLLAQRDPWSTFMSGNNLDFWLVLVLFAAKASESQAVRIQTQGQKPLKYLWRSQVHHNRIWCEASRLTDWCMDYDGQGFEKLWRSFDLPNRTACRWHPEQCIHIPEECRQPECLPHGRKASQVGLAHSCKA